MPIPAYPPNYGAPYGYGGGPAVLVPGPVSAYPVFVPYPVSVVDPGPLAGPMPADWDAPEPKPPARRADPARSVHYVTFGDRQFRAGNTRHALDRYRLAARANPNAASPRVRLAQVAFVRGDYAEAAALLREAVTSEPGWLLRSGNIQTIYGEPADFARPLSKLESHLQAEPADRDAWLVLGAQLYLTGQTRKAADVFLRLTDRKPDTTLAAFLEASTAGPARPPK